MNNCSHPYEAWEYGQAVALVPKWGGALVENKGVDRERVVVCGLCGAFLVPNGVLASEPPATSPRLPRKCQCGKPLTQPYAREMGECFKCYFTRIRRNRGYVNYSANSRLADQNRRNNKNRCRRAERLAL